MTNYILDRYFNKSTLSICVEATLCGVAVPILLNLLLAVGLDNYGAVDLGLAIPGLLVAPWLETLVIFVPILELLRCQKNRPKARTMVWIVTIIFAALHLQQFLIPLFLGFFMACVYLIMRRFSFFHAVGFTTLVHFCMNFMLLTWYGLLSVVF